MHAAQSKKQALEQDRAKLDELHGRSKEIEKDFQGDWAAFASSLEHLRRRHWWQRRRNASQQISALEKCFGICPEHPDVKAWMKALGAAWQAPSEADWLATHLGKLVDQPVSGEGGR